LSWDQVGEHSWLTFFEYRPLRTSLIQTLAKVKSEKCFEGLKSIHLVETSPVLREKQRDKIRVTLSNYGGSQTPIHFHDSFIDLVKSTNL
jgi:hypothetical protein